MSMPVVIGSGKDMYFKYALGSDNQASELRKQGKLKEAYDIFIQAEPSEFVLDELRKIASAQAHTAKKQKNWFDVVYYLEGYNAYASKWKDYCYKTCTAWPPVHTKSDTKLLDEARGKLAEQNITPPSFDYETVEVIKKTIDLDKLLEDTDKELRKIFGPQQP